MKARLAILLTLLLLLPIYAGNQVKVTLADGVKLTLAGGGDLVVNGHFSTVTTGWFAESSALLASVGAGKSGNCLSITENGGNNPVAYQDESVTAGKRYKFDGYVKAGTEDTYQFQVYDHTNHVYLYQTGWAVESAGDWSTSATYTFAAPVGCTTIRLYLYSRSTNGEAKTIYFDSVTLKEIPTKITIH